MADPHVRQRVIMHSRLVLVTSMVNTEERKPHLNGERNLEKVDAPTYHPDRDVAKGSAGGQRGDAPGGSWRSLDAGLYEATLNAATKAAASEG